MKFLPTGVPPLFVLFLLGYHCATSFQVSRFAALGNARTSKCSMEQRIRRRSGIVDTNANHRFLSSTMIRRQMLSEGQERPEWACDWMPTWLITLRPVQQLAITFVFYLLHTFWMGRVFIPFPYQLIPNNDGDFQFMGLDSLAGIVAIAGVIWLRNSTRNKQSPPVRRLWRFKPEEDTPWKFPHKNRARTKTLAFIAFTVLTRCYFFTVHLSDFWDMFFASLAGYGFPITEGLHRSLSVLMGHISWVVMAGLILSLVIRPQPFFGGGKKLFATTRKKDTKSSRQGDWKPRRFRWFVNQWDTYWLWWVIGGYLVSCWLFNVAEYVNRLLLPPVLLEAGIEGSVVTELTNPVNNDILASFVGFFAPCVSAPWFEEILYRGYALPALALFMPFWPAILVSGLLFSVTHLNWPGFIPLMMLGWTWATLYSMCGNLLVTILIHVMWNSRVFISSWFGV